MRSYTLMDTTSFLLTAITMGMFLGALALV